MPRARGGHRTGTPGQAYSNRTDMQAVRTAPSTSYGEAKASADAQRAVPLPQAGGVPSGLLAGPPPPPPVMPGDSPFGRPSERPGEPLTHGMSIGAGAGPGANQPAVDPVVETLRAAMRAFPNEAISSLLERMSGGS